MSHVWHLVRHDLRAHRTLLLAWLALGVGQSSFALLPWSEQIDRGLAFSGGVLLVAARVVLGALAIAAIVQADSPTDDRAFWRTRPIAAGTMASAHFLSVLAVFVLVPALATLLIGVALGLPPTQWLRVFGQVALTELASASLGLLVAARTRSAATFLIGVVLAIGVVLTTPAAVEALVHMFRRPVQDRAGINTWMSLAATMIVGALVLPALFFLAMAGPRRKTLLVVAAAGALALSTSMWFLPWAQVADRWQPKADVSPRPRAVRVIDVHGSPGTRAILADVAPEAARPGELWQLWLEAGTLTTPEGPRVFGRGSSVSVVSGTAAPREATVITTLSVDEHRRWTGMPMRLHATVQGGVTRRVTVGTAVPTEGATIAGHDARLTLRDAPRKGEFGNGTVGLVLRGLEVAAPRSPLDRRGRLYVLRDATTGCEVTLSPPDKRGLLAMDIALLPTLSRPFVAARLNLEVRQVPRCEFEPARAHLEMRSLEWAGVAHGSFSVDFTMPAIGEVFTPTPAPGPRPAQPNASRDTSAVRKREAA